MAQLRGRPAEKPGDTEPRNGIRAIPIAFAVLEAVASVSRPSALREIAERANLTSSRTHRYLAGLVEVGMVRQTESTGQYDIGEKLAEFGLHALGRVDPMSIGAEMLAKLSSETGIDSHLTVWGTNGPTVMRWQQGSSGYAIKVPEGGNLPLLDTATGRVFLAYMPAAKTEGILSREMADWKNIMPPEEAIQMSDVETMCSAVRSHGLAAAIGTGKHDTLELTSPTFHRKSDRGIAALAAPVFTPNGICMVLTLIGVLGSFDTELAGRAAQRLKAVAEQCSARLVSIPSG